MHLYCRKQFNLLPLQLSDLLPHFLRLLFLLVTYIEPDCSHTLKSSILCCRKWFVSSLPLPLLSTLPRSHVCQLYLTSRGSRPMSVFRLHSLHRLKLTISKSQQVSVSRVEINMFINTPRQFGVNLLQLMNPSFETCFGYQG